MIAGLVATIEPAGMSLKDIIADISSLSLVEVGEVDNNATRIPMTVEASAPDALEEITQRIGDCCGVVFVDVVYVHFEDEADSMPAA